MNHPNYGPLLLAGVVAAMTWKVSAKVAAPRTAFNPDQTWPDNNSVHITGGYVWLPITFEPDRFTITWHDTWDISIFGK